MLYVVGATIGRPRGHKVTFTPERVVEDVDPYNLEMNIVKLVEYPFSHGYSTNNILITLFRKFFAQLFYKKAGGFLGQSPKLFNP